MSEVIIIVILILFFVQMDTRINQVLKELKALRKDLSDKSNARSD